MGIVGLKIGGSRASTDGNAIGNSRYKAATTPIMAVAVPGAKPTESMALATGIGALSVVGMINTRRRGKKGEINLNRNI